MSHVLLLRTPSDGKADATSIGGKDQYETALAPATSIPMYETVHTLDELQWILETGPAFHGYKGVIVTSKRAVDAWAAAARKVPPPVDERSHWTDIPFYVVGSATASAVKDLSRTTLLAGIAPHLAPRQVLGGEEAGTGEQLAHFILSRLAAQREAASTRSTSGSGSGASGSGSSVPGSHSSTSLTLTGSVSTDNLSIFTRGDGHGHGHGHPPPPASSVQEPDGVKKEGGEREQRNQGNARRRGTRILRRPMKFLFLVGDKTRDALPNILSTDESVEVDSVQVYETKPSPNFPTALRNAVQAQPKVKDWWVVIFAPSGADYAIPYLREHFILPSSFNASPASSPTSTSTSTSTSSPTSPSSSSNLTSSSKPKKEKKSKKGKDKGGAGGGGTLQSVRIAAIGPTTAVHLRETCRLDVAAVAAKPNAEALAAAIRKAK